MRISLDKVAKEYPPTRAHKLDAGIDLYSPVSVTIRMCNSAIIDTGVHAEIPTGYAGVLVSKSGLNCKHSITSTGLIDAGYTGSIKVKLYNHSRTPYIVEKGDKISQLVIIPVKLEDVEIVDTIEDVKTERGNNGFGSTGR